MLLFDECPGLVIGVADRHFPGHEFLNARLASEGASPFGIALAKIVGQGIGYGFRRGRGPGLERADLVATTIVEEKGGVSSPRLPQQGGKVSLAKGRTGMLG